MLIRAMLTCLLALVGGAAGATCAPSGPNPLDQLGTVDLQIEGQNFRLWIADNDDERARGLMHITAAQMGDLPDGTRRGMIFVFDREDHLSFWMKNTIIALDIAYLDMDGLVVGRHTMIPLDTRIGQYPSGEPAQYAIEVNAHVFSDIGLDVGDVVQIPDTLLKR